MVREFIGAYSQRGLVIVISDFLDDGGCERALQYLADFGHELMLLQIWAEEDRTPPWTGELELRDAETGRRPASWISTSAARRRYTRSAFDEYCAGIETMAMRSGGRYAGVATSQIPGERALRRSGARAGHRMNWGRPMYLLNLIPGAVLRQCSARWPQSRWRCICWTVRGAGRWFRRCASGWRRTSRRVAARRRRIQQPWSLVLQLVGMALLLLAVAQLRWARRPPRAATT